jgi:hypothetical protein
MNDSRQVFPTAFPWPVAGVGVLSTLPMILFMLFSDEWFFKLVGPIFYICVLWFIFVWTFLFSQTEYVLEHDQLQIGRGLHAEQLNVHEIRYEKFEVKHIKFLSPITVGWYSNGQRYFFTGQAVADGKHVIVCVNKRRGTFVRIHHGQRTYLISPRNPDALIAAIEKQQKSPKQPVRLEP